CEPLCVTSSTELAASALRLQVDVRKECGDARTVPKLRSDGLEPFDLLSPMPRAFARTAQGCGQPCIRLGVRGLQCVDGRLDQLLPDHRSHDPAHRWD